MNKKEKNTEQLKRKSNILKCPNCNEKLTFLMPNGKYIYCNKCEKYYLNNNGNVGNETISPYKKKDVLY